MQRKDLRGLDKFALLYLQLRSINNCPSPDRGALEGVLQFWTAQANIATVFATIFSSISIVFLVEFEGYLQWIALLFAIAMMHFLIRAWSFGRCAGIAISLWK